MILEGAYVSPENSISIDLPFFLQVGLVSKKLKNPIYISMLIIIFIIRNKKHLAGHNKLCIIIIIKNKMYYSITYHHYKSRPPFQIKEYLYS